MRVTPEVVIALTTFEALTEEWGRANIRLCTDGPLTMSTPYGRLALAEVEPTPLVDVALRALAHRIVTGTDGQLDIDRDTAALIISVHLNAQPHGSPVAFVCLTP